MAPEKVIRVTLKDGVTVFDFEDAAQLRLLLHDRPGFKPEAKGKPVDFVMPYYAWIKAGPSHGTLVPQEPPKLRYLNRSSIQTVEEVGP